MSTAAFEQGQEKSARKLLLVVGVVVFAMLMLAMVAIARRSKTVPFYAKTWATGRGKFTTDNPRRMMADEVVDRIQRENWDLVTIKKFLGEPDAPFAIETSTSKTGMFNSTGGEWFYVLGVDPRSFPSGRKVATLSIYFPSGKPGIGGQYAYVNRIDYPPGSKIVPVNPIPTKGKPVVPTRAPSVHP
jgi:hypothetical protein